MKNIEYVNYLDEPGEDFGTPNSIISTPEDIDYEFKEGGRVGMATGGIMKLINKLIKGKKMGAERAADLVDLMDQAKKAGIPIKTMKDLENFEKQIKKTSGKVYESRKKYPGVEGEKSGLPVKDKNSGMFDDIFEKMYGEYELDKLKKSGRKTNAEGGLNYLLGL
tara:strand:- start:237 stop:731 length:495 start_codon:yes stop_codon:yes gene_type:complete